MNKIFLFLHLTWSSENLVQIGPLVTEFRNVGENLYSFLNNNNLFEKYNKYEKKFISKTVLFFDFMSGYQFLYKSIKR